MKKIIITTTMFLAILASCTSQKKSIATSNAYEIEVIKFMNLNLYPRAIDEDIFWGDENEHARFKIKIDKDSKTFKDEILTFKKADGKDFLDYEYAILIKKEGVIDTLYSDKSLLHWKYKNLNYSDEKNYYPSFLRGSYSFFNDCW